MLSPEDRLRALVEKGTHIQIPAARIDRLMSVVKRHYLGMSASEAVEALEEWGSLPNWLTSEVTINETFFFRHPDHFQQVGSWTATLNRHVTVLCCGVSNGPEAWSLAATLEDAGVDYSITGVDLDRDSIQTAKTARYSEFVVGRTPASHRELLKRYLDYEKRTETWTVKPVLRDRVRFVCASVFSFPMAQYDLIFSRNMLIYFNTADQTALLLRLLGRLSRGGRLYIGAGELFPANVQRQGKLLSSASIQNGA